MMCVLVVYSVIQILKSSIKQTSIVKSSLAEGRFEELFIFEALGLQEKLMET